MAATDVSFRCMLPVATFGEPRASSRSSRLSDSWSSHSRSSRERSCVRQRAASALPLPTPNFSSWTLPTYSKRIQLAHALAQPLDLVLQPLRLGLQTSRLCSIGRIQRVQVALDALRDLLLESIDLHRREVAITVVYRLELAAVDGHDGLREQLQFPAFERTIRNSAFDRRRRRAGDRACSLHRVGRQPVASDETPMAGVPAWGTLTPPARRQQPRISAKLDRAST